MPGRSTDRSANSSGGDDARAQRRGKVLALGGPEAHLHLLALDIARGPVVEDGVAEDMLRGIFGPDVAAGLADDDRDLQLVVQFPGVGRIGNLVIGAEDVIGIGEVEDGELVPFRRHLTAAVGVGGLDMRLEGVGVAQRGGPEDRGVQA